MKLFRLLSIALTAFAVATPALAQSQPQLDSQIAAIPPAQSARGENGMAGAEPFGLFMDGDFGGDIGKGGANRFRVAANHSGDLRNTGVLRRVQHMQHHRPAGDFVQHL